MTDLYMVLFAFTFFLISALYLYACDHLMELR